MKKHYVIISVVAALCIGGAFYGGMQYEKNVVAKTAQTNVRNFAGGIRQGGAGTGDQTGQRGMGQGGGMRRGGQSGGGFVAGEILSKDDKSLTVKTSDGGSTIVYFSPTVLVRKAEVGSLTDLATGQQVVVNGKGNADGSLSADTVQIAPKMNQ